MKNSTKRLLVSGSVAIVAGAVANYFDLKIKHQLEKERVEKIIKEVHGEDGYSRTIESPEEFSTEMFDKDGELLSRLKCDSKGFSCETNGAISVNDASLKTENHKYEDSENGEHTETSSVGSVSDIGIGLQADKVVTNDADGLKIADWFTPSSYDIHLSKNTSIKDTEDYKKLENKTDLLSQEIEKLKADLEKFDSFKKHTNNATNLLLKERAEKSFKFK